MNRKISVFLVLIILFSLVPLNNIHIASANGSEDVWYIYSQSGNWNVTTPNYWKSGKQVENATLIWRANLTNALTLYSAYFNSSEPFLINADFDHIINITYGNAAKWITIKLLFRTGRHFFGQQYYRDCNAYVYVDSSPSYIDACGYGGDLVYFRVMLWRPTNDLISYRVLLFLDDPNNAWKQIEGNYTLGASTFNSATLQIAIQKFWETIEAVQWGYVEGWKWTETLLATGETISNPGSEPAKTAWERIVDLTWATLYNAFYGFQAWVYNTYILPALEGMPSWLGDLWKYMGYATTIIVGLFQIGVSFLPYFLGAYLLWLLCLVVASIVEGSFDPLYNHLQDLYHFLANVINMFVNVAQTIWDYITFWS